MIDHSDLSLAVIALAFLAAGLVKGATGLGLPPVAMAILAIAMPPVEAASLVVLPSLLANLWQTFDGAKLVPLVRRLWPLLLAAILTTLAGAGWLAAGDGTLATTVLGIVLMLYATSGLVRAPFAIGATTQRWAGPLVGTLTGAATAATGVSSVPVTPYLQAIGLEREELIQAMGLSFTVSTVALGVNLSLSHAVPLSPSWSLAAALVAAGGGVWAGTRVRRRVDEATFRRIFLVVLFGLGLFLVARAVGD